MTGKRKTSHRKRVVGLQAASALALLGLLLLSVLPVQAERLDRSSRARYTPSAPRAILTSTPAAIARARPLQLTDPGCCANPDWSSDSDWVVYFDSPGREDAGLFAVPTSGGEPLLVHARVGVYSNDLSLVAYKENGQTYIERWVDGTRWLIDNQGREVMFSPDGRWVTWSYISSGVTFPNLRQRTIWIAAIDGSEAHEIVTVTGGEFLGWTEAEEAILVSGRLAPDMPAGIWRIQVDDGAGLLLHEVEVPLRPLVSPQGRRIAFVVAFEETGQNGLWVVNSDGSGVRRLNLFGAYRWMGEDDLLVIPMDLSAGGPSLWHVAVESGVSERWLDLAASGHGILNNDWAVSPDGTRLVFRSTRDAALWAFSLPATP